MWWSLGAPGPGDATVLLRAKVPALRTICKQPVSLERLDDEFAKSAQFDDMVEFGEDLREVALERCLQLQPVARRASRGGG